MVEEVRTEDAPLFEEFPFSQAIVHETTVYVSGQVGIDPSTEEMVAGGVRAQTEQIFANISTVLAAVDLSVDDLVKTTVYLEDMGQTDEVNDVFRKHVTKPYPARSTIGVEDLYEQYEIEIESVAAVR